jgi:hypothetical protein
MTDKQDREALIDHLASLMDSDDREKAADIFARQIALLKMTEDEAAEDARLLHRRAVKWLSSSSGADGSFQWACDEFDLDAGAVRRAIREKK